MGATIPILSPHPYSSQLSHKDMQHLVLRSALVHQINAARAGKGGFGSSAIGRSVSNTTSISIERLRSL